MNEDNLLLRLRYSIDPEADTFFEWEGSILKCSAFLPDEPPKKVFYCVGMNVGKAAIANGMLQATSRELTYYCDPVTRQKLTHWDNPWTGEKSLPVVHIANDPVQMAFPASIPLDVRTNPYTKTTKVLTEIPLFYPNPLATADGKFDAFDPAKMYQAAELFTFTCATEDADAKARTVPSAEVNWTRVSRFSPFMKMGDRRGYLVFHCTGNKLPPNATYRDLRSPILRDELEHRLDRYRHAPKQYDAALKSQSSWTYFRENFDLYQQGEAVWPPSSSP
ncbi:hypothetical protein BX666DRAFT_1368680 [Dichotomocladium elegans]|nr:hypothetical protein BX666DRAFT_1368680 [Dichotomocladium elegans]